MSDSNVVFTILKSLSGITNHVVAIVVIWAFYKTLWGFKDALGEKIPGLVRVRNFLILLIVLGAFTEIALLQTAYETGSHLAPAIVSLFNKTVDPVLKNLG